MLKFGCCGSKKSGGSVTGLFVNIISAGVDNFNHVSVGMPAIRVIGMFNLEPAYWRVAENCWQLNVNVFSFLSVNQLCSHRPVRDSRWSSPLTTKAK